MCWLINPTSTEAVHALLSNTLLLITISKWNLCPIGHRDVIQNATPYLIHQKLLNKSALLIKIARLQG